MKTDPDFHPLAATARRANDRSAIARKPVIIGNDVFLGANVLVLKGARTLSRENGWRVLDRLVADANHAQGALMQSFPNLLGEIAIYRLTRK